MDLRLVGSALVVLAGAVIAIWLVGRRTRERLGLGGAGTSTSPAGLGAAPPLSPVAKELQARGLVTAAQLASMSETERQLLFSTMAGALGKADAPEARPPIATGRPVVNVQELPPLHCPLCSFRIEQFTSTPPITGQCETCGTKVVVRRDGARLLLTVAPPNARA